MINYSVISIVRVAELAENEPAYLKDHDLGYRRDVAFFQSVASILINDSNTRTDEVLEVSSGSISFYITFTRIDSSPPASELL